MAVKTESVVTKVDTKYGFKWNPNPPITVGQYAVFATAIGLSIVLAWLAVISVPLGGIGIAALYPAGVFMVAFCLWFGGWGLLAAYLGNMVGAGLLLGFPLVLALPYGLANIVYAGIPLLLYRLLAKRFGVDPLGKIESWKAWVFYVIINLIASWASAFYGVTFLRNAGFVPPDVYWISVFGWAMGNMILVCTLGTAIQKIVTPVIERLGLTVHGIVS